MSVVTKAQEGKHGLIEMPKEYTWSKTGGVSENRVWLGSYDDVLAQFNANTALATQPTNMSFARIGDSMRWKLLATFSEDPAGGGDPGTEDNVSNTYELEDNQLQLPSCQSAYMATMVGGVDIVEAVKGVFDQYAASKLSYDAAIVQINAATTTCTTAQQANALLFFADLVKGIDSYFEFHTVFRRTATVVNRLQLQAAFVGIKKVWTTAQVEFHEGIGIDTDIYFSMPSYKWLKIPPRVSAAANQRTQISYEYWGADEWNDLLYETFTP